MGACFDLGAFNREGFAMQSSLLPLEEVAELIALLETSVTSEPGRGGTRDVMDAVPTLKSVAAHQNVLLLVRAVLGEGAFPVRATLFDKTDASNWKVPWHQDVTIAVQERYDEKGYGPWSVKSGVLHAQPPTAVLARMLTVRIHLDPCPATNGALRVMSGTHTLGRVDQNDVTRFVNEELAVTCTAKPGDALLMRPLLLHASSSSLQPAHRRVLHFDFAAGALAGRLTWRMR